MPMTIEQIKVVIDTTRAKLDNIKQDSFAWIIAAAIKADGDLLLPENHKLLNEYMRTLKCSTSIADDDIVISHDFIDACKDVSALQMDKYLIFMLSQREVEENIISTTILDEESLIEEEDDENLSEEERSKKEEERQAWIDDINATNETTRDNFQEFFLQHFCKILLLIENGQLSYAELQISNMINQANPDTLLSLWKLAEFSQTMEILSERWRTIVLQKILDNLKSSSKEGIRNELLKTPLANKDLFIHAAASLQDDHKGHDIRLMNRDPNPGEFTSTTCFVYELRNIPLSDEQEEALKKENQPIPQKYILKHIMECDALGDVQKLNLTMHQLGALKPHIKIDEAPLNRVTPDQCDSIREFIPLELLKELETSLVNSHVRGHTFFQCLLDEVLCYTSNEDYKDFWKLNRAHNSAVVIAAKNKALRPLHAFIVAKNHIDQKHQFVIKATETKIRDLENKKTTIPANFMLLPNNEREEIQNKINAENAMITEERNTLQVLTQAHNEDTEIIRKQMGIAALELAKNANTRADWDMVLKLLQNGAKQSFFEGAWPYNIAHYAIKKNEFSVFQQLIRNQAVPANERITVNIVNPAAIRPVTPLICATEDEQVSDQTLQLILNEPNIDLNFKAGGETALYCAAKVGNVQKVLTLLRMPGIDIESKDNNGVSATAIAEKNKHQDVVNLLKLNELIEQIYNDTMPRRANISFLRNLSQETVDSMLAGVINRKLANGADIPQDKQSRMSFILSECVSHFKPFVPNALLAAPAPVALSVDFLKNNLRDANHFVQTSKTLNDMFTLIRHSDEKKKYQWLGNLRQRAYDKLIADVNALQDDYSKRNLLIEARTQGIFQRHRSTCCLFRIGRTDTQIAIDKQINELNRKLGLRSGDRNIVAPAPINPNP